MKLGPSTLMWILSVAAIVAWVCTFVFAGIVRDQETNIMTLLVKGKAESAQRASASASAALAGTTALGRARLEGAINRDILTLSDLITQAGQNAGVPVTIVSVTPGPGPTLPRGSILHPSSILFSARASGTYAQLITAVALLENLPADSALESVQFSRAETPGQWNMTVTIGIVTGSSITS